MINCLCENNYYLYLLILLLVVCCGGCGCVTHIAEKILNCKVLIPLVLLLIVCNSRGGERPTVGGTGGFGGFGGGCGCGK